MAASAVFALARRRQPVHCSPVSRASSRAAARSNKSRLSECTSRAACASSSSSGRGGRRLVCARPKNNDLGSLCSRGCKGLSLVMLVGVPNAATHTSSYTSSYARLVGTGIRRHSREPKIEKEGARRGAESHRGRIFKCLCWCNDLAGPTCCFQSGGRQQTSDCVPRRRRRGGVVVGGPSLELGASCSRCCPAWPLGQRLTRGKPPAEARRPCSLFPFPKSSSPSH